MIKYKFVNSSKKIEENEISSIEKEFNIKIPLDLKDLYLKYNGGEIEGDRNVYLGAADNEYSIKTFMPIKYKRTGGDTLLEENTNFFINEKHLIPRGFIVFAIDWGTFPYCYDIESGNIYFANIEHYDTPNVMMEIVSSSLENFINGMVTEEEAYG